MSRKWTVKEKVNSMVKFLKMNLKTAAISSTKVPYETISVEWKTVCKYNTIYGEQFTIETATKLFSLVNKKMYY